MQIASHSRAAALVVLTVIGHALLSDAMLLRQRGNAAGAVAMATQVIGDVDYKVLNKTSLKTDSTTDCLCKIGTFWHWRIKSCIKQGPWAYECGFFPAEHHNKVCQDGLKCQVLNGTDVKYQHPGAVPASCQACTPEDKCLMGKERHSENCLKEYKLTGEACQTVRLTVMMTATAKVTEKVTEKATAEATAKATAKEEAKVAGESATKKATAEGTATADAKAAGTATATAKATEEGTAEGKACISVQEAKELLKLGDIKRIGAVLSAQVVARADEQAFDLAYEKALEAAQKAGLINAKQAAEALASAEAREKAALEAKAKAEEAAAWKAEAGASKEAQNAAKEKALAEAEGAASKAATEAATAAAKAEAEALAAEAAAQAAAANAQDAEAQEKAKKQAKAARAAAAVAKAKADAAAKAAAEAKARQDAIADVVNPKANNAPARPTTAQPTSPPRKISPDQIAAKLP